MAARCGLASVLPLDAPSASVCRTGSGLRHRRDREAGCFLKWCL
jgi:hypothetical protein